MTIKKAIITLGLTVIIILLLFSYNNKNNNQKNEAWGIPEKENAEIVTTYSRVNFFLAGLNKASLAIPDYWEGNYRIKEQGDTVTFYFVRGVSDEISLFSIFHKEKSEFSEGDEIIGSNSISDFVFSEHETKNLDDNIYYKIIDNIEDVVKSFKAS